MAKIRPTVNQIEVHPLMTQEKNIAYNHSLGIQVEAWGPFGQVDIDVIGHPLLQSLAAKYQKTASQIVLLDRLFYSNLHTDWTMKVGASVSIARRGGATTMVFRQLDEHTWIGNGHRVYNESLYLVEGNDRAILIDAGTVIPGLEKIVAKITSKPVTMMLTHAHGDHAGGIGPFPEVYLNDGDLPIVPSNKLNYQGQIKYLYDGEVINLGGREIEVIFTPGHTAGSTTFFDKARHYGFSGDAFGSTNLLVFINLSTEMYTAERIERYMKKNDIRFLFPGHYSGDNLETLQRVTDIKDMCREILDGTRQPTVSNGNNGGMDMMVDDKGVRINFSSRSGMK